MQQNSQGNAGWALLHQSVNTFLKLKIKIEQVVNFFLKIIKLEENSHTVFFKLYAWIQFLKKFSTLLKAHTPHLHLTPLTKITLRHEFQGESYIWWISNHKMSVFALARNSLRFLFWQRRKRRNMRRALQIFLCLKGSHVLYLCIFLLDYFH